MCQIQVDAHSKTLVRIPLGDIYMVKILTKKELWTCYNHSLDCDMTLPKWVSEKYVKYLIMVSWHKGLNVRV